MCKQWNQSGADSKQKCHDCKKKMQYGVMVTLGERGPGNQQKHLEYIVGSG